MKLDQPTYTALEAYAAECNRFLHSLGKRHPDLSSENIAFMATFIIAKFSHLIEERLDFSQAIAEARTKAND